MLAFSESALQDADVLLYVTDVVENPEKNMDFLEKVQKMDVPIILLINKIDELANDSGQSSQDKLSGIVERWHLLLPKAEILPISAKNKFGTDVLLKRIQELLPERGKGEKHPDEGSERVPETSRLQAVGACLPCDGVPFA